MKIKVEEIKKICLEILTEKGLKEEDALAVFQEYLDSELSGKTCHGFQAFPKFGAKLIDSEGEAEIIKEGNNFLYINGKKNLGQIVCNQYVPKLIDKAEKGNIAMMGISNMHSYLKPGTYARMIAENNLVGFVFNYGGWERIAPYGSINPFFGTNPIAIGVPGDKFPIVVDMATSSIAMMKVRMASKLNQKIPEGVAIDKNGQNTTDPNEAMDGALLPFGGYKGSALALMVELLTKTMFKVDIHDETKANRGFLFIAFDPASFIDPEEFKKDVSVLASKIKTSRKAEGIEEIFVPGEKSETVRQKNLKNEYLDLEEKIINDIKALL
jgi:LDH2 family malate/lactate/ureidoglycolate dehydrogenase